jgi:protein TonB
MTAKMFSAFDYGMHEMSGLYRRHASIALAVAVVFHVILISMFSLISPIVPEYTYIPKGFPVYRGDQIYVVQPPIVHGSPAIKAHPVHIQSHKAGLPVPVSVDERVVHDELLERSETVGPITGISGNEEIAGGWGNGEGVGTTAVEFEPSPDILVAVERLPVPVKQVNPEYPVVARLAGVEGTVWLKVLVDKQGKPKRAIVQKSDYDGFNESAINAALQWAFTPAMMNSGPVVVWVSIPFRFQLKN